MVGSIIHNDVAVPGGPEFDEVVWNKEHEVTPFLVAEILSDHDKTLHDALGIIAATHSASHLSSGSDTIANATGSTSGFMSSLDKAKLDGMSRGTVTLPSYTQSIIVNHGLSGTPYVTISAQSVNGAINWISDKNTTSFTINIDAPQQNAIQFDWMAML